MLFTQVISRALFGLEVETAGSRLAAHAALERAVGAVVRLDATAARHPRRLLWRRLEQTIGLIEALGVAGEGARLPEVLRALLVPRDVEDMALAAAFERRRARWSSAGRASHNQPLRPLIRAVAGVVAPGLAGIAERAAAQAASCVRADRRWHIDADAELARVEGGEGEGAPDLGDVAMATPFALRAAGLTSARIGSLVGDPRILTADHPPLERLERWASVLERQATDALDRLTTLERFDRVVDAALAGHRRPGAVRRAVDLALVGGTIWAAKLAAATGVNISNAWRTLEQACHLRLLVPVAGARRSRGDAQVYVASPVARAAALVGDRRPATLSERRSPGLPQVGLDDVYAEADEALATLDRILARSRGRTDSDAKRAGG